jgi:hypothetical protein
VATPLDQRVGDDDGNGRTFTVAKHALT